MFWGEISPLKGPEKNTMYVYNISDWELKKVKIISFNM